MGSLWPNAAPRIAELAALVELEEVLDRRLPKAIPGA